MARHWRASLFLGFGFLRTVSGRTRVFSTRGQSLPQDLVQLNASDTKILKDSPVYGGSPWRLSGERDNFRAASESSQRRSPANRRIPIRKFRRCAAAAGALWTISIFAVPESAL
jgi:hypothetical protein